MTATTATVVDAFAADYFVTEGLTEDRQRLMLRELRALEAHAGGGAETLDDLALRDYLTEQLRNGLHVNTVRKHLHAIRPFYVWAWRRRIIDAERLMRIRDIEAPRGSSNQGLPRPYKTKEVHRFWDQLDARWPLSSPNMLRRFQKGQSHYRRVWMHAMHLQTQAVTSLALFGGLRASEIRLIDIDDLHPDNDFIVVRNGKGGRGGRQGYREVPYTAEGRQMVADWLAFRAIIAPAHDRPWLVLTSRATPHSIIPSHPANEISEDGFKALMPNVGKWELHRFRHTAGTEWLRAGVPLERVSKLLGHATLTQTLGYAELVPEDVARDVRRAEADFATAVGRRAQLLVR